MTHNLLALREWDEEDQDDRLIPAVRPDRTVELASNERTLWEGPARVETLRAADPNQPVWQSVWKLWEPKMSVTVTTDRIIYLSEHFDKGSTWVGFGGAGLAAAAVFTTVSKARAAQRRRGKVAIGQVRFQWLTNVMVLSRRALLGPVDVFLLVTCWDSSSPRDSLLRLQMLIGREAPTVAEKLVQHVAGFRLRSSFDPPLAPEARAVLERQLATPTAEQHPAGSREELLVYNLPGARKIPFIS